VLGLHANVEKILRYGPYGYPPGPVPARGHFLPLNDFYIKLSAQFCYSATVGGASAFFSSLDFKTSYIKPPFTMDSPPFLDYS